MNTNNKIYLDANFLTFWALPKDEEIKKKVRVLLAMFLARRVEMTSSCLALDEMWFSVKKTYNGLNNETKSCFDEPIYQSC